MSRSGIQLCYPFEQKRLEKWNSPVIVQPKLDGERCRAVWMDEIKKWKLISSELNLILSVPHITEALMDDKGEPQGDEPREYDGELYVHGLNFETIHSIVGRTVNLHSEFDKMEYHIFDVVNEEVQFLRTFLINSMNSYGPLKYVPYQIAKDFEDVMNIYNDFLSDGYEGMIVRNILGNYVRKRTTNMMKFKPKKDDFYKIVGFNEEINKDGVPKGTLGSFICVGDDGTEFSVGSGFTREQRIEYWEVRSRLLNQLCHVQYQNITSGKKVPRFPIFIDVVEI